MATITEARDADHALALANDSEFGLSATVYTTSEAQASVLPMSWSAAECLSTATAPAMPAWRSAA